MSDLIFIAATVVFFAICALYVHWCDKIIGPDDFLTAGEATAAADDTAPVLVGAAASTDAEAAE